VQYSCKAVNDNCHIIVQQFEEAIALNGNQDITVDLQDLFLRFTIDNTAKTTFGFSMQSLQAKQQPPFAAAFDELQDLCLARMIDPFFEIKRMFQLTSGERRIRRLQKELQQFCRQVIKDKREAIRGSNGESHMDILGLFLRYGKQPNESKVDEELIDVILNFMVAGRDTTAAALSWIFYELSKQSDVVEKIVAEAASVFGPPDKAEYMLDGLNHLKYTHCVIMEALRLHPPVPVDSKFAIRNDTLPDGTYIPAKSLITYQPFAMGHNEEIYGPDTLEFKPERFFGKTEPSPFSFIVFNAGPRLCLGKPLAMLTMKLVLVQLLPRFHFRDDFGHPGTMKWSFVGKMKGGFKVQVSSRRGFDDR
jgi:cytochrome P450